MYKEYFGLKDMPFSIAPDPDYLYMSDKHREALAHLVYGINSEGAFILLSGEVGTGKTTISRSMLERLPEDCDIAFIINPRLTDMELLESVCDELGIKYREAAKSVKVLADLIYRRLLKNHAAGRKTLLLIDEAQNLSPSVLEQLRLLTNLETNRSKLLQVILIGQPELRDMLSLPMLRQLSQRITARFHLNPLSRREVDDYIRHRLSVAGVHRRIFPSSVTKLIYRLSGGVPRLINLICDRSLLGAYVEGMDTVTGRIVKKSADEVMGSPRHRGFFSRLRALFIRPDSARIG